MKEFQIADIARLCGINAHTLRMWESRYNILTPSRSKSNYRTYSLLDVDYLLKISLLNKQRFRISGLARMDAAEIEQHLKALNSDSEKFHLAADRLIVSMFAMNTEAFEALLDGAAIHWGLHKTIEKIILPFIERVQLFSCRNCAVEMDLVITALRKKIILAIERTNPKAYNSKTLLLFLPNEEYFDLFILYFYYLARRHGFGVLYMGTNVSVAKVKNVAERKQPHRLITYASDCSKFNSQSLPTLPYNITLISSGRDVQQDQAGHSNMQPLHFSELAALLSRI